MLKYNLHDSLIEKVNYLQDEKKVEIVIELCNWLQDGYKESDPETLYICITFEEVQGYETSMKNYKPCNDMILEAKEIGEQTIKFTFLTENDVETIIVTAKKTNYTILV